jgi:hypothetical protein
MQFTLYASCVRPGGSHLPGLSRLAQACTSRSTGEVHAPYCDGPQASCRTGSDNSSDAFQIVMECRLFDAKAKN